MATHAAGEELDRPSLVVRYSEEVERLMMRRHSFGAEAAVDENEALMTLVDD